MMQPLLLDTLLVVGTMALIIAFVGYQIYLIRWLPDHGRQITALVTSIRHETGKSAWGISRGTYYLTATWTNPHTGQTYTFWS
jgi:arginyl-tRNA synthetase